MIIIIRYSTFYVHFIVLFYLLASNTSNKCFVINLDKMNEQ